TIVHVNRTDPAGLDARDLGPDVAVLATTVNRGFGGACNHAAAGARGELLVFLNDDAEVQPGWLEALIEAADADPEAGVVGSLVCRPDGTIQEVGSFVWRDGSTFAVGRDLRVDDNPFPSVRRVDFSSACSLLVRRSAFEAAGGFDERYYPAYYEDVDLCFSVRRLGKRILCEPRSRVVHHEASSTRADYREFLMRRNRSSFVAKWPADLAGRDLPPADAAAVLVEEPGRIRTLEERFISAADGLPRPDRAERSDLEPDRAYLERELAVKSEFLAEVQARLAEADWRAERIAGAEAKGRESIASLENERSGYAREVEELRELLRQPRHRIAESLNAAVKRNASFLHRALKSLLGSRVST
ncbi:MAG: glycosyltransferase, partial [Candidatus Binatia bacterium]